VGGAIAGAVIGSRFGQAATAIGAVVVSMIGGNVAIPEDSNSSISLRR
jgi:hypothetical protein